MTNLNDIDRRLAEARARQSAPPPAVHKTESGSHFGRMWRPALRYARHPGSVPAHEAEAIRAAFEPVLLYVLLVLVAGGLYGFSQGGGGRAAGFALIALAAGLSVPLLTAFLARANHAAGAGHGSSDGSAGPGHGDGHGHREAAQDDRAPLAAAPAVAPAPLAAAPVAAAPAEAPAEPVVEANAAPVSPDPAVPPLDAVESGIARLEATIAAGKPKRPRKAAVAKAPKEEAPSRTAKRKTVTVAASPGTRPAGERAL
jgi:hypothetical protein